jgi:hypothetical protein
MPRRRRADEPLNVAIDLSRAIEQVLVALAQLTDGLSAALGQRRVGVINSCLSEATEHIRHYYDMRRIDQPEEDGP